jgi:Tfp pilus assembly protein PilN
MKRSERILLALTLAVVGGLFFYARIAEPRVRRALLLHAQIADTEQDLAETRLLIEHREEILGYSEALQKQIAPEGDDEEEQKGLMAELERLARDADLSTVSLRPGRIQERGYYRLLGAEIVSEGEEREVARFLHSLGGSSQLLRVDRMQLNATRQAGALRAEFQIVKVLSPRGR